MNFIEVAKAIFQLMPVVIEAVKQVEAMFPEGGKGQLKLEMVRSTLEEGYKIVGNTAQDFAALWPALNAIITVAVKLLKK